MRNNEYWGAADRNDIASLLQDKVLNYYNYLQKTGVLDELRRSYALFHGNSKVDEFQNGKTILSVNHYGSLIRSLHVLITQNRPAFEARAVNSDYNSQATTILANGLLDYFLREQRLEVNLKDACLLSLYLREGWVVADWEAQSGEVYGVNPESQTPIYEGDVKFSTYSIMDVIRPITGQQDWHIIRKQVNRFDLAAQYPELESEILENSISTTEKIRWALYADSTQEVDSDDVEVLTLYHAKTPALPQGRLVQTVGDTVLIDTALPYKKPYVFCIKAQDQFQTNLGHSPAMDLIPMQIGLDTCFSIAVSNINSFGLGTVVSEKGSLSVKNIQQGLLHLEHNKGSQAPSMLNMLQIPKEIFDLITLLSQSQETISAVNSVARGNVEGDMSGTAMALIAQQALTFSSGLQHSYNTLTENIGSALIELLQTYAVVPRIAQIAGKSKKSYMKEFKGTDLQGISRIVVDSANSFAKSTAGKVELANNLLQSGFIKTGEQYLQVVSTGQLESLIEHEQSQLMLIRTENEMLGEGQMVSAVMVDDHSLHVLEHAVVLNNPEVRNNPQILQAALGHIQEHINLAKSQDPVLSMMLKQQPLAQPTVNPGNINQAPPQTLQDAETPELPTNPLTNQQFDPTGQGE